MNYEVLLNRAHRFDRRIRRSHKSEFINLINAENGLKSKLLDSFEKQLANVKSRLLKGMDLLAENSNIDEVNSKALISLKIEIENSQSYFDLNPIIEEALYFTQEIK